MSTEFTENTEIKTKGRQLLEKESNALRGAVFEGCRELGYDLLVNFGCYPKVTVERIVL